MDGLVEVDVQNECERMFAGSIRCMGCVYTCEQVSCVAVAGRSDHVGECSTQRHPWRFGGLQYSDPGNEVPLSRPISVLPCPPCRGDSGCNSGSCLGGHVRVQREGGIVRGMGAWAVSFGEIVGR